MEGPRFLHATTTLARADGDPCYYCCCHSGLKQDQRRKKTKELGKDPPEGSKPENRSVLINNNKSSI